MPDPAEIFKRLDRNGDQQLSVKEFSEGMKRLHADMAEARQKSAAAMRPQGPRPGTMDFGRRPGGPPSPAAAMRHQGPRPGTQDFGRRPGGPPSPAAAMVPSHVRERLASLPPEARKKALEAMKERFQDRAAAAGTRHRGEEARSHDRKDKDDDRGEAKERKQKKDKEEKEEEREEEDDD
jgi:hypothetical protein